MSSIKSDDQRNRRRLVAGIKDALRDLKIELTVLNRHVGARVELKDVDFECLEVLNRYGPLSPTALARRAGLHPATITGILDRLERGGWVVREREPGAADRRAVTVRALRDRNTEVYRLLSGMNSAMDGVCAEYTDAELELIADFLSRTTQAGGQAGDDLRR